MAYHQNFISQEELFMFFVGIDVAKSHHDIAIIDDSGQVILRHIRIMNNRHGFNKLHQTLIQLSSDTNDDIRIAMEATGHYHLNLISFLQTNSYSAFAYNPFLIKEFSRTLTLRKTKTDKADALTIAKKLATDLAPNRFKPIFNRQELKFLTRHRNRLTANRSKIKGQYIRILDMLFPELASLLGKANLHNHYVYALLEKYPSPAKLSRAHTAVLLKLLQNRGNRSDTVHQLKVTAKQSIGLASPANELELIQTITMIRLYDKQIAVIDQKIEQLMSTLNEAAIITSITGISNRLGSVILSEINNFNNFNTPDQLLAFAGLEPAIYQSGQVNSNGKMVKRGSASLRWALFQAAEYASRWSPIFRQYRQKKINEGKHYFVAVTHVAKKLVRIIFYLIRHHQFYDESKLL